MYDDNIYAEFVADCDALVKPARMGEPTEFQLKGTDLERLAELAGRVCYDSLGRGRSSEEYHQHILEVGHLSVYEHCNWTVRLTSNTSSYAVVDFYPALMNRPGVWCRTVGSHILRVTLNARALLEWDDWIPPLQCDVEAADSLRAMLYKSGRAVMPMVFDDDTCPPSADHPHFGWQLERPDHPEEKWISLLIGGSRGMSHELVRHGDRTAISQRSTRYVDEHESPWVEHPLVGAYNAWLGPGRCVEAEVDGMGQSVEGHAQHVYRGVTEKLQGWLTAQGVHKATARKQARGAARGWLGNALHTELIFSASVAQWHRILKQRGSSHADAEIRRLARLIDNALQSSVWSRDFGYTWGKAADGVCDAIQEYPA